MEQFTTKYWLVIDAYLLFLCGRKKSLKLKLAVAQNIKTKIFKCLELYDYNAFFNSDFVNA